MVVVVPSDPGLVLAEEPLAAERRESAYRADTSRHSRTSNPPRAVTLGHEDDGGVGSGGGGGGGAGGGAPGIGIPGGYQLPFAQVQSGPGRTVWHGDVDGGGGGGGGGGAASNATR